MSPKLATVELPPTLSKVIPLFVNALFGIAESVLPEPLMLLFVSVCVSLSVTTLESIAYVTVSVPAVVVMSIPVPPTSVSRSARRAARAAAARRAPCHRGCRSSSLARPGAWAEEPLAGRTSPAQTLAC